MRVAGVDVGGTNIAVAVVAADHRVVERAKVKTPSDGPDAVIDAIAEVLDGVGRSTRWGWARPVP
jgi:glucokinase